MKTIEAVPYLPREFDFLTKQIELHLELYNKYVENYNENYSKTYEEMKIEKANATYSEFSEWQKRKSVLLNGIRLHELFFENIKINQDSDEDNEDNKTDAIGMIEKLHTPFDKWKEEMIATGKSVNGWVLFGFYKNAEDGQGEYEVIAVDGHTNGIPTNFEVVVAIDTWEHAYLVEFGIDKDAYFEEVFEKMNWNTVLGRFYVGS
jgi:Fe-Mn family superoxide dismutase